MTLADYRALVTGVGNLTFGSPNRGWTLSTNLLYGKAMVIAAEGDIALVVAARYGQGYVVQLPNENLMWFNLTNTSMGRLIRNAVAWASGGKVAGMRVGSLENGYAVVTRNLEAVVRGWI
jgi:hypothetical protein